jgi:hypothetical protein
MKRVKGRAPAPAVRSIGKAKRPRKREAVVVDTGLAAGSWRLFHCGTCGHGFPHKARLGATVHCPYKDAGPRHAGRLVSLTEAFDGELVAFARYDAMPPGGFCPPAVSVGLENLLVAQHPERRAALDRLRVAVKNKELKKAPSWETAEQNRGRGAESRRLQARRS